MVALLGAMGLWLFVIWFSICLSRLVFWIALVLGVEFLDVLSVNC